MFIYLLEIIEENRKFNTKAIAQKSTFMWNMPPKFKSIEQEGLHWRDGKCNPLRSPKKISGSD